MPQYEIEDDKLVITKEAAPVVEAHTRDELVGQIADIDRGLENNQEAIISLTSAREYWADLLVKFDELAPQSDNPA